MSRCIRGRPTETPQKNNQERLFSDTPLPTQPLCVPREKLLSFDQGASTVMERPTCVPTERTEYNPNNLTFVPWHSSISCIHFWNRVQPLKVSFAFINSSMLKFYPQHTCIYLTVFPIYIIASRNQMPSSLRLLPFSQELKMQC